jgi:hypothetical protein
MTARPNASLYDRDFFAWTQDQAAALRRSEKHLSGRGLDIEHLAEEIEDMGNRERRELRSRIGVVLVHLLKWQFQSDRRSGSWRATLREQREQIQGIIGDSPSLAKPTIEVVDHAYAIARLNAADETGMSLATSPERCPYTLEQVLDDEFLPEA